MDTQIDPGKSDQKNQQNRKVANPDLLFPISYTPPDNQGRLGMAAGKAVSIGMDLLNFR